MGNPIHIEVDEGVFVPEHPFDLDRRAALTPQTGGYRVERAALGSEFGAVLQGARSRCGICALFSGKTWSSFNVGSNAQINADAPEDGAAVTVAAPGRGGRRGRGGLVMERYAMRDGGHHVHQHGAGDRGVHAGAVQRAASAKELADRAVVTWTLNEGNGGIQAPCGRRRSIAFRQCSVATVSSSCRDGVNAKDGVVGIFPLVNGA